MSKSSFEVVKNRNEWKKTLVNVGSMTASIDVRTRTRPAKEAAQREPDWPKHSPSFEVAKSSSKSLWRTIGQRFDPLLSFEPAVVGVGGVGGVGNCRMRGDNSANGVLGFEPVLSHDAVICLIDRLVRSPVMSRVREPLDILPFTGGTLTISAEIGDTGPSSTSGDDDDAEEIKLSLELIVWMDGERARSSDSILEGGLGNGLLTATLRSTRSSKAVKLVMVMSSDCTVI